MSDMDDKKATTQQPYMIMIYISQLLSSIEAMNQHCPDLHDYIILS